MHEMSLRKRIEALERTTWVLRHGVSRPGKRNVNVVSEGTYQGHPTITFEAGGHPFTPGFRRASVVLYLPEHVKRLVSSHKARRVLPAPM
jgi:hypothetical protein